MESRNSSKIPFLNESPVEGILGAKLPTGMIVFRHFWHHFKVLKKGYVVAVRDTAKAVVDFWTNAGMAAKHVNHITTDIKKWYDDYQVTFDSNFDLSASWANCSFY